MYCRNRRKQQGNYNVNKFDIENIEDELRQSIDFDDKNIHAIIIGGLKSVDQYINNCEYFKQVLEIFNKFHIPCSVVGPRKDIPMEGFGEFSILYTKDNDTLWITDSKTETVRGGKHEVQVTPNGIEYYIYEIEGENKTTTKNNKLRVLTGIEDFLKSRFEEVKLCSFDEFA